MPKFKLYDGKTRSEHIRESYAANPNMKNSARAAALKAKFPAMKIDGNLVSTVLSQARLAGNKPSKTQNKPTAAEARNSVALVPVVKHDTSLNNGVEEKSFTATDASKLIGGLPLSDLRDLAHELYRQNQQLQLDANDAQTNAVNMKRMVIAALNMAVPG